MYAGDVVHVLSFDKRESHRVTERKTRVSERVVRLNHCGLETVGARRTATRAADLVLTPASSTSTFGPLFLSDQTGGFSWVGV